MFSQNQQIAPLGQDQNIRANRIPTVIVRWLRRSIGTDCAIKGKFSKDALHRLTKCLSMNPIGSLVELDDQSTAVVVRVNSERPMTPVVRLLHTGHREIDLGKSNQFISGPHISDNNKVERLNRARLLEVLWKTDR